MDPTSLGSWHAEFICALAFEHERAEMGDDITVDRNPNDIKKYVPSKLKNKKQWLD